MAELAASGVYTTVRVSVAAANDPPGITMVARPAVRTVVAEV
jgi:hypothetical protein